MFDITPMLSQPFGTITSVRNARSPREIDKIISSARDPLDAYMNPQKYGITSEEERLYMEWEKREKGKQSRANEELRRKGIKDDYKARHGY